MNNDNSSLLGFNGERIDPVLGGYHLGNGYRLYSPSLRRFTSPDSMSPFGQGGINPYAYCEGDPINHTDPTGHVRLGAIFEDIVEGIDTAFDVAAAVATGGESLAVAHAISGVVGIGTEIASQSISGHPTTHKILDGISILGSITNTGTGLAIEGVNHKEGVDHKNEKKRPRTARGVIKLTNKVVSYTSAVVSEDMEVVADGLTGDPSRHKVDTQLEKASTGLGVIASVTCYFDAAPDIINKKSGTRVRPRFDSNNNHNVIERHTAERPRAPQPTPPAQHADPEGNDLFGPFFGAVGHRFSQ
jgi:RHS repeat-associated core domain